MPEETGSASEQTEADTTLSLDWRYLVQAQNGRSPQHIARVRKPDSGPARVTMFKGTSLTTDQLRSIADFVDALDADTIQP